MQRFLFALMLFATVFAHAEPSLTPYEAEYKVKFSIFGGRLTTRLVEHEAGYQATHSLTTTGMSRMLASGVIEEQSVFHSNACGLVPQSFKTSDELTNDETSADLTFDWEDNTISGEVDGASFSMQVTPPTHDRVSIQYQLMADLLQSTPADQYRMFDIDEIKLLNIEQIGERSIRTEAGRFDAIGIRHQSEGSSRATTFWMVEELGYAPALIEQHRDGKLRLKATLTRYEALGHQQDQQQAGDGDD